jgi:hypothetical protein
MKTISAAEMQKIHEDYRIKGIKPEPENYFAEVEGKFWCFICKKDTPSLTKFPKAVKKLALDFINSF